MRCFFTLCSLLPAVLCAYTNTTLQLVASSGESSSASYTAKGAVPATGGTVAESSSYTHYSGDAAGYIMQPAAQRDTDSDGLLDSYEQTIIDADLGDAIDSLDDVLPGDDFDGDGRTNLQEQNEETDPIDADSYRTPPPVSLAGKTYQFSIDGGYTWTVPLELVFGSATYDEGFAGSLLDADQPYTYANGVVTTDGGDELRLTFTSATSGSFESWDLDEDGFYLEEAGTFNLVTPSLVLKNDWQRSETMNSPLSTNYWNSGLRGIDSLEYNDGELNFVIGDGGYAVANQGELEVKYGRTLPMDENWQVVLDDIFVSDSVELFEIKLEVELPGTDFECGLKFGTDSSADYGNETGAAHVGVGIEYYGLEKDAFVDNSNDARIGNSLNLRVVHLAISRELVFEYQPEGASGWTELARLNLANGGFTGSNARDGGFSGELVNATQRMAFGVQVEAGQAIEIGDLTIGGIEIGSYTPSETTWYAGASYVSDGWRYFGWFKGFKPAGANWIYHGRHGWLYTLGADTSSLFLWDVALGRWMFTNEAAYPWIYAYGPDGGWVFFFEGGRPGSRYFKRGDTGQTLSEQQLRMAP